MRTPFVAAALLATSLTASAQQMDIPYEKFELANGLDVIVHEDHSDPVVAVYLYYHVGSGREEVGRSGFAHLFEHMMFQGSEHVGDDQHFKLIQEAGGTLNGSTTTDRTNYFEILPSNQLELALWLESDRMGFLLPAMTQEKLDNQRDVVKNERRQNYENRPYAQAYEVISAALYPEGHPYSWITIGSMEDLSAASMDDVKSFFRRWYGPNNATLVVAGDVDFADARALVEKWFGGIPRGPEVHKPAPRPVQLTGTQRLVMEDRVALPQVGTTWPTVNMDHSDEAALDLLADVLSANKSAVLDKALMIDEQLASAVTIGHDTGELAGALTINLRPQPGVTLDRLEARLHELLAKVAADGVDPEHLQRLKNRREGGVIRSLETVSGRANRIARDNCFRDDPGFLAKDLARYAAVTPEDVVRVLKTYVIGKPSIVLSVVPERQLELAAKDSAPFTGPAGVDAAGALAAQEPDRMLQPEAGAQPEFRAPGVWTASLANGVAVTGTTFDEVPLTRFTLSVPAGRLMEDVEHAGLASMTADLLGEGTQRLSSTELLDAFDGLGATFSVSSDDDEIGFSVSTLNKHLPATIALLEEVILQPRFAQADFDRLKKDRLTALGTRSDNINAVASDAWGALLYGTDSVEGMPAIGTVETTQNLELSDVVSFWKAHGIPRGARLTFVGGADASDVTGLFQGLAAHWKGDAVGLREASFAKREPQFVEKTSLFLVDRPGVPQSEIRIGHPGVSSLDPDYYSLYVLNYILGGSFSSRINLNLREDKGYTYGARSGFGGGLHVAPFTASAGVRTDVTAESVKEFVHELTKIVEGVTEEELDFARSGLVQAMGRQFESMRSQEGMLDNIGKYGWPVDYLEQRLALIGTLTTERLKELAAEHIHPDRLTILVVGDRAATLEKLEQLGLGEVTELDLAGRPVARD